MRSLPPRSYLALAKLTLPASYVCVARDVDSECYRIDATQDLPSFIEQVLAERDGDFGIELLAITQVDDLPAFEALLSERHDAALGGEWLSLDDYQLRELRGSFLQINAFHSQYLSAQQHQALAKADAASAAVKAAPKAPIMPGAPGIQLANRVVASDESEKHRQRASRRRIRTRYELWNEASPPAKAGFRQRLTNMINDFMINHPGLVIAIILFVILISLIYLNTFWTNMYGFRIR